METRAHQRSGTGRTLQPADHDHARARMLQALMAQVDASERERLRDATEALAALLRLACTDLPEDSRTP